MMNQILLTHGGSIMTGGVSVLYCLIAVVLLVLWVQLLLKKRKAEKANAAMFGVLCIGAIASLVFTLLQPRINQTAVIFKSILLVPFLVFFITELVFYCRSTHKKKTIEESDASEEETAPTQEAAPDPEEILK